MPQIILAIETSCDETAAAILKDNIVLSNIISSQEFHSKYGGIVPELASRAHIDCIDEIANIAFKKAGVGVNDVDIVAATAGPGLIGSLLVGLNFAKAFAIANGTKFSADNHIDSHVYSPFIGRESIDFPFLSLVVSGGHTILILVSNYFAHQILGQAQDDAAGEAFDKVAKLLGLNYPGGPIIDKLAGDGNENFHEFPVSSVKDNIYDFSFSGIKTSVLYFLRRNYPNKNEDIPVKDICASFQKAVVNTLYEKTLRASENFKVKRIAVSGGVSANTALRDKFNELEKKGYEIFFPEIEYSTDNAAMVGYAAYLKNKYSAFDSEKSLHEPAFANFSNKQI